MDLSSTAARTVLRIPSLYFVMRSLGMWILVLLHANDRFPSVQWQWARELEYTTAHLEMEQLCWATFLSVCGALFIGALTRGLEGGSTVNAAPFNLVRTFISSSISVANRAMTVRLCLSLTHLLRAYDPYFEGGRFTLTSRCTCAVRHHVTSDSGSYTHIFSHTMLTVS